MCMTLDLFIEGVLLESVWPKSEKERYKPWYRGVKSRSDLLEHAYHRTFITKTLAVCDQEQSNVTYLYFLLRAFSRSIKGTEIK